MTVCGLRKLQRGNAHSLQDVRINPKRIALIQVFVNGIPISFKHVQRNDSQALAL